MKIGFITSEYPHEKISFSGGIGTSIAHLAKGLIDLGHEVIIFTYGQDQDEFFSEEGIDIIKIKNIKFKGLSLLLTQQKMKRLINDFYNKGKVDIIEAPDWTGFTSFLKPDCPIILKLNGSDTYFCHLDHRKVKWKNRFLEKRAFKNADGIISVSKFTGDLTNDLFKMGKDFEVIPNSIDVQKFVNQDDKEEECLVLYFGTLIRKKGMIELPKIFNKIQTEVTKAKLLLVGNDSYDIKTESISTWELMQPLFSKEALANTQYLGPVSYQEIQSIIQKSTVCVFPTFAEALPVSWLEAMAMKKAIVASNIGWANEVIEDGVEGYLVHPTEHHLYAKRVITLLKEKQLRVKMGENARNKIATVFDISLVAPRHINYYSKFINKN